MPDVGPKSVTGSQVGPAGSRVRKFVVFQTPPTAAPAYTVFPDGSDGSTAIAPIRPALSSPGVVVLTIGDGPTAVHAVVDPLRAGLSMNRRKPTVVWSATGSPR